MEVLSLNLRSPRARKSRYAKWLGKSWLQKILTPIIILSVATGVILILVDSSWGYIALVPALVCFMLRSWYKGSLLKLTPLHNGTIEGLLDPQILAEFKTGNPSALDVWQAAKHTNARYFFQNRYTFHDSVFDSMLDKKPGSASLVWQRAEHLSQKYQTPGLSSATIIVALLKSIPNIEQLLRSIQVELSDIEEGIEWLADLDEKRRLASEKNHFGGWARDWTYGYTPLLRYLGHNITGEIQTYGFFSDTKRHEAIVGQMIQGMDTGNSAITLLGDIGTGKTTCVYAFAEKLVADKKLAKKIRYSQVVALDAPSLLSQVRSPGELEGLVIRLLKEAKSAKNIILFFDDAHVFFGTGTGSVDLSNVLAPVLESGAVRLILAMTPKEWQVLQANNAAVASKLQTIQIKPADEKETIKILQDQVVLIEYQRKALFTYQALREAYKLGSRYVDTAAMPGAALNILKAATPLAHEGYVTADVIKASVESSVGVKLKHAEVDESKKLLNLEDELHKYVINQKRAVGVIANALRRSRSGVGNPDRPVGTFLFLGPTGVGKTELSKALARVYFGSEAALIRVDMNQYLQPSDAQRLISPLLGDQLGFLGQVKKQPFSVILLDEIEKAHPNVVNLLLQMLDEGVMRDTENKTVSFKDAIIIATSNAGADEIRKIIDAGEDLVKKEPEFIEGLINKGAFAPEFLNRFDEVVLFRPLNQSELVQVIDLIIAGINKTLDAQKVSVTLSDEAKKWLVEKGYDSKLGARPMRRMVQRYVENILAKKLLEKSTTAGGQVHLDVADLKQLDDSE